MRWRDWVTVGFASCAMAAAVLAMGGAFRWSQALVAVLVALALAPTLLSRQGFGRVSPLLVVLGIPLGLSALQLVPLPPSLIERLDPVGEVLREDGSGLFGISPWHGLSLDAPGTLRALAFFAILAGVAVVALRIAASERGRYRVLAAVAVLCGATAAIAWLHALVGATRLYGIYDPHATPPLLGPLLNSNHLGGLMAVGTLVALGLAMHPRQATWQRIAWLAIFTTCAVTTVATRSRGATLSLGVGALVTVAMFVGQRLRSGESSRRRMRFASGTLPIAVVAICTVIVIVYSSAGGVEERFAHTTVVEIEKPKNKLAAWKSATALIDESPWVGVGRGAFEPSFTHVHPASGLSTYSHLENEYLQAVVDWGIPGAALVGIAMLWLAAVGLRRWHDGPLAAGALGSLAVIALQSNVDFGIEMLGLAVPVTAIAATLAYVPLREVAGRRRAVSRGSRLVLVAGLAAAAALLLSPVTTTVEEDHEALGGATTLTLDAIRGPALRHPLDYYPYALAARVLVQHGDNQGIRMLNHAMLLHPTHPDLHRFAANLLIQSGHLDQAAIEFAAAIRDTGDPHRLIAEILPLFPRTQAATAIPADYPNVPWIIKILSDAHRDDIAADWLERVLELRPGDTHACEQVFELGLHRGNERAADLAVRRCLGGDPSQQQRRELAHVFFHEQRYAEVVHVLGDIETWRGGRIPDMVDGWLLLCDAQAALQEVDAARRCLHRLEASFLPPEQQGEVTSRLEKLSSGTPPAP